MAGRGRPKKDKNEFAELPEEFVTMVENSSCEEIRAKVCEVTLNHVELMEAKAADQDLAEKQELFKEAGAVYREGSKMNKLKIKFLKGWLEAKGDSKSVPKLASVK